MSDPKAPSTQTSVPAFRKPTPQFLAVPADNRFPIVGIGKRVYHNPATNPAPNLKYLEYSYLDQQTAEAMKAALMNLTMCTSQYSSDIMPSAPAGVSYPEKMPSSLSNLFLTVYFSDKAGIKTFIRPGQPSLNSTMIDTTGNLTTTGKTEMNKWTDIWTNITSFLKNYMSVAGWFVWNHPSNNLYTPIKTYLLDTISTNDKEWDHIKLENLYPINVGASAFMGVPSSGSITTDELWSMYTDYTKNYRRTSSPQIYSFDFRPFRQTFTIAKNSTTGAQIDLTKDAFPLIPDKEWSDKFEPLYIGLLDLFRSRTNEMNGTFWIHLGADERQFKCKESGDNYTGERYPKPILTNLNFQIYCALAYGAQGFYYSGMFITNSSTSEKITRAPLELFGQTDNILRTPSFNVIKDANKTILRWEPVFLNCRVLYCAPASSSKNIVLMSPYIRHFDFNHSTSHISSFSYTGGGFLVSMLQNMGFDYVVLVNLDFAKSQTMNVKFREDVFDMDEIIDDFPDLGTIEKSVNVLSADTTQTITVQPGEMKVYRVIS